MNNKLALWRIEFESNRLNINRCKAEYMECKFSEPTSKEVEIELNTT